MTHNNKLIQVVEDSVKIIQTPLFQKKYGGINPLFIVDLAHPAIPLT